MPQFVYDAIKANATRAELIAQGNGISGAAIGIPFPISKWVRSDLEPHFAFSRVDIETSCSQAAPTADGSYGLVETSRKFASNILVQK